MTRYEKNDRPGKSWYEVQTALGAFEYSDSGFTITRNDFTKTLNWSDITELNVYKKDRFTVDEIRMQIVYGDKQIEISEDLPGWYQFVSRTKTIFPGIPKDWDAEIIDLPFATNYRTIYSAEDCENK